LPELESLPENRADHSVNSDQLDSAQFQASASLNSWLSVAPRAQNELRSLAEADATTQLIRLLIKTRKISGKH